MNAVLFKCGQRPHIEQFRSGLLYMNAQKYFAELEEDNALRADRDEGTEFVHQPAVIQSLIISYGDEKFDLAPHLTGPFKGGRIRNRCNLFCMYGLTEIKPGRPTIDPRICGFGDSYTIVTNTQEFLDRVLVAADAANLAVEWNLVEYLDFNTYSGEVNDFQKSSEYAFHREFRIAVYSGSTGPIQLKLDSLEDITSPIQPLDAIDTSLEIVLNRNISQGF